MVSGSWPGEIFVFQRKPNRMFEKGKPIQKPDGELLKVGSASAAAVADWNGDGRYDLLLGEISGAVHVAYNQGTAENPVYARTEPVKAGGSAIKVGGDAGPCVADWDGDGVMDLLVGDGAGAVVFFKNVGTAKEPKLAEGVVLVEASGYTTLDKMEEADRSYARAKPAVVDWNGDGRLDLMVGDFYSTGSGDARETHGHVWVYVRKADAPMVASPVN